MAKFLPVTLLSLCAWLCTARAAAAPDVSLGRDFHIGYSGWNGLSRLAGMARDLGCALEVRRTLDWSVLDGQDILLVLHPETALNSDSALRYLSAGGRMILADDFGEAKDLFARLNIVRHTGKLPPGATLYRKQAALPVALPQRGTVLGRAAAELCGNHPAYFSSSLPATYVFAPGAAMVIEGTLGHGRFVAISDSSIFINNMLEIGGNRDFLARLLIEYCRPERDRLLVLYGPFAERGTPPVVLAGAPISGTGVDTAEHLNSAMSGANSHIQEMLHRGKSAGIEIVTLCGLLFCLGALALLLRYLPMPIAPQDETFAQPPRPPETGLFASIVRYAQGAGQAVDWGYVYPATLLREEVLLRIQPFVSDGREPSTEISVLDSQQIGAELAKKVSPRAGELAVILLREVRRLDRERPNRTHPSSAYIRRKTLHRWYGLATELFAELRISKSPALSSPPRETSV